MVNKYNVFHCNLERMECVFLAQLIDGKQWALVSREETAKTVSDLKTNGLTPGLVVILLGEHPASLSYVKGKDKAATAVGILSELIQLPTSTTEAALLQLIERLNHDDRYHGILVQLPLPQHMNEETVIRAISPQKDVDGFHPLNVGALTSGLPGFIPCTPLGVMKLLAYEGISVEGKNAVVIGRSNIVGKPMAQLLLRANATVTICHSKTHNLASFTREADLLIAAIGRPNFITGDIVKPGATVIDVGINRVDGKLCGDVEFSTVDHVAGFLTPVPGGVGPMTIAMLLHNTVEAAMLMANMNTDKAL